jgi:DnaK suppressor protein
MVRTNLNLAQQILESHLARATSNHGLGDSIHIHQAADPVDMTQEAAARDLAVQMLDRESELVRRVRSAIDRIQDGSYGICLRCEEEIAPSRLKAIPWAELCIHCQEQAEDSTSQGERVRSSERWTKAA